MVPAECASPHLLLLGTGGGFSALTGTTGKCARIHLGCTPLIKSLRAFLGDMTVYSILNHDLPRLLEPRASLALSPPPPVH